MNTPPDAQAKAGRIAHGAIILAKGMTLKGCTSMELEREVEAFILDHGGKPALKGYKPPFTADTYKWATCQATDYTLVHGEPSDINLDKSQIHTLDLVVECDGWHADTARTWYHGDDSRKQNIIAYSTAIFDTAKMSVVPNAPLASWGQQVDGLVTGLNQQTDQFNIYNVVELCGHGIGETLHDYPQVINYYSAEFDNIYFVSGKAYAVEPVLIFRNADDNSPPAIHTGNSSSPWPIWSNKGVSTHNEDTIFIAEDKAINLTDLGNDYSV
jgi:methionyl aminopeptidase